jgi:hypothetical protein
VENGSGTVITTVLIIMGGSVYINFDVQFWNALEISGMRMSPVVSLPAGSFIPCQRSFAVPTAQQIGKPENADAITRIQGKKAWKTVGRRAKRFNVLSSISGKGLVHCLDWPDPLFGGLLA